MSLGDPRRLLDETRIRLLYCTKYVRQLNTRKEILAGEVDNAGGARDVDRLENAF